jgi:uncharacterized protein YodC (DUF2158 family)
MTNGDTVRLKSGSELMTIEEISSNEATCVWMDKNKEIKRETFKLITLELDNDELPMVIMSQS